MSSRKGNSSILGTIVLWVIGCMLIVGTAAGIKYVINTDFESSSDSLTSDIIPVSSEDESSSEDSSISSETVSSEIPSSSEEEISSEVEVNPFDLLQPSVLSEALIYLEETPSYVPLSTTYRSSDSYGVLNLENRPFTFNSLKYSRLGTEEPYRYGIGFGFPGTITAAHTNNIFGLPTTYTSYLLQNFKIMNDAGIALSSEDISFETTAGSYALYWVYRSNDDLTWKHKSMSTELNIPADDQFYQIGIAFNTSNKSNNLTLKQFRL